VLIALTKVKVFEAVIDVSITAFLFAQRSWQTQSALVTDLNLFLGKPTRFHRRLRQLGYEGEFPKVRTRSWRHSRDPYSGVRFCARAESGIITPTHPTGLLDPIAVEVHGPAAIHRESTQA
jgi:hypothetical protein